MKVFDSIADITKFIDLATDAYTTGLLYNNTKRAKRTLMIASVSMSVLAIGVSWYQTKVIVDNIKRENKELKWNIRGGN